MLLEPAYCAVFANGIFVAPVLASPVFLKCSIRDSVLPEAILIFCSFVFLKPFLTTNAINSSLYIIIRFLLIDYFPNWLLSHFKIAVIFVCFFACWAKKYRAVILFYEFLFLAFFFAFGTVFYTNLFFCYFMIFFLALAVLSPCFSLSRRLTMTSSKLSSVVGATGFSSKLGKESALSTSSGCC